MGLAGVLIVLAATSARAGNHPPVPDDVPPDRVYYGPDHTELDIIRTSTDPKQRVRIFVQATLPDGQPGLFMVDTGAAISAISGDTAERLGVPIMEAHTSVEGLGGRTDVDGTILPTLQLGADTLPNVEFAVDVRGIPESVDGMPLDGILGNNVWGRFILEIDYPADILALHRPGTLKMPRSASEMWFQNMEVQVPIDIHTRTVPEYAGQMIVQVDTGASELMVAGSDALPFQVADPTLVYSQGLEPVMGIGAADTMPSNVFLRQTRRIPLTSVGLGGKEVPVDFEALWINFDRGIAIGPQGLRGLAGHELLHDHVAIFDYQGGRFALKNSHRKARALDGHDLLLAQDVTRYGDDASRYLYRARMHAALEHWKDADDLLMAFLAREGGDPKETGEARVLLAAVRRLQGDLEGAWKALEPMTPAELVEQGEIDAAVNGFLLDGRKVEGLALADAAVAQYSKDSAGDDYEPIAEASAHVARADALLALAQPDAANEEILVAARHLDNPDAHLLRRARIALARGDRYGAMADIRRLLQLYPSNGQYLWFYATLLEGASDSDTFKVDMDDAMGRLHREDRPLDYLVHAHHLLGDQPTALDLMRQGLERDCYKESDPASRSNCEAWYYAMAGTEPDKALQLIDHALELEGDRSDFLDTKAMVHLSRGEYDMARDAAVAAARLSPDEVYMLWQAERITTMADNAAHGTQTGLEASAN